MNFWRDRWIQFLFGIVFGIGYAIYQDYDPFSLGIAIGIGIMSPLVLIMGFGISALTAEGYTSLKDQSFALFLAAGVPLGAILGSYI